MTNPMPTRYLAPATAVESRRFLRTGFKRKRHARDYSSIILAARKISENLQHENSQLLIRYDRTRIRMRGEA